MNEQRVEAAERAANDLTDAERYGLAWLSRWAIMRHDDAKHASAVLSLLARYEAAAKAAALLRTPAAISEQPHAAPTTPPDVAALANEQRLTAERDAAWAANERDRTAYARFVASLRAWSNRWSWLREGRGPYEWDDDRWREEFGRAQQEIVTMANRLEKNAHATDLRDCPTTQEAVAAARAASSTPDVAALAREALELSEAATAGPWVTDERVPGAVYSSDDIGSAIFLAPNPRYLLRLDLRFEQNAAFAARARTLLPLLARAVLDREGAVEEAQGPIEDCPECEGSGDVEAPSGTICCDHCEGTGKVREAIRWRNLPTTPPDVADAWIEYDEARIHAFVLRQNGAAYSVRQSAYSQIKAARARLTSLLSGARALTAPNDAAEEAR